MKRGKMCYAGVHYKEIQHTSNLIYTMYPKFEGENFHCFVRFLYFVINVCRLKVFLKLDVCLDKYLARR